MHAADVADITPPLMKYWCRWWWWWPMWLLMPVIDDDAAKYCRHRWFFAFLDYWWLMPMFSLITSAIFFIFASISPTLFSIDWHFSSPEGFHFSGRHFSDYYDFSRRCSRTPAVRAGVPISMYWWLPISMPMMATPIDVSADVNIFSKIDDVAVLQHFGHDWYAADADVPPITLHFSRRLFRLRHVGCGRGLLHWLFLEGNISLHFSAVIDYYRVSPPFFDVSLIKIDWLSMPIFAAAIDDDGQPMHFRQMPPSRWWWWWHYFDYAADDYRLSMCRFFLLDFAPSQHADVADEADDADVISRRWWWWWGWWADDAAEADYWFQLQYAIDAVMIDDVPMMMMWCRWCKDVITPMM